MISQQQTNSRITNNFHQQKNNNTIIFWQCRVAERQTGLCVCVHACVYAYHVQMNTVYAPKGTTCVCLQCRDLHCTYPVCSVVCTCYGTKKQ